jgi:outer membrane protein OmpA-like peptidoglycan-associated protein
MRPHYKGQLGFFLLVSWWLALAASAGAAEVVDFDSRIPSVDELEQGLRPDSSHKTRGIKILQPTETLNTAGPTEALKTISLELTFDFDSDRLSKRSVQVLDNLGAAIAQPSLSDYRFRVEGHTDSAGTAAYNQRLSERRAKSVRSYLLTNFRIPPTRLQAVGMGEESPKEGTAPEGPANRRVQITTLEVIQKP